MGTKRSLIGAFSSKLSLFVICIIDNINELDHYQGGYKNESTCNRS